jgi:GT2 family glycosyltransferase
MDNIMLVSVVIPSLGRFGHLKACLNGLTQQTFGEVQILVVHDGPARETISELVNSFNGHYIEGPREGVVPAYNLGVRKSTGDLIAFTDDDAVPNSDWIERLAGAYSPGIGGVGGTVQPIGLRELEPPLTSTTISKDGRTSGWLRISGGIFEVDHLRGANMSFSRDAINKTGLFDWNYVGDGSKFETDYCVRIKRNGFKLLYEPRATVVHAESDERPVPRRRSPSRAYYKTRNNTYFVLKNFGRERSYMHLGAITARRLFRTAKFLVSKRDVTYACGLAGFVVGVSKYALNDLQGDSLSSIGFGTRG